MCALLLESKFGIRWTMPNLPVRLGLVVAVAGVVALAGNSSTLEAKPQNVELEIDSDNQIFKEGDGFSLTCTAEGYPKPNLTLLFNDDPYEVSGHNQLKEAEGIDEDDEASMTVQTVHWNGVAEYPGQYRCKAENDLGTDYSAPQRILVTDGEFPRAISVKLKINGKEEIAAGEVVSVVEGDDLLFTCRANKELVRKPITWMMNDEPLDVNEMEQREMWVREIETRLSRVSTIRTSSSHILQYYSNTVMCMEEGGGHSSLVLYLQEMTKPMWREEPLEKYQGYLNETLTLNCSADATPPLTILWRKGSCIVVETDRVKMNGFQLYFEKLLPEDIGKYICEISNRAGSLSASFTVDALDKDKGAPDQDDQETSETTVSTLTGFLIACLVVSILLHCRTLYQNRKTYCVGPSRSSGGDPCIQ